MNKTNALTKKTLTSWLKKATFNFSLIKLTTLPLCLLTFVAISTNAYSANVTTPNRAAGNQLQQQSLKIQLTLTNPNWTLALDNKLVSALDAELKPHEMGFARQIKPLMAANDYQGVADLFKTRALQNDSVALQLLRGQILLMLKDLPNAELAFKASLKKMPDLAKAHQSLSLLYMQEQEYVKAQQHLIRSVELGRADAQVYAQLGFIHVQNDQPWSAIAAYRQALMLQPQQAQYQRGLLFALIESGDLTQARVLLKELINKTPNDAQLWLQRGQIALEQGDQQQALTNIEISLKLQPLNHSNQLLAAQLHLNQGSSKRAVELLKLTLTNLPKKQENTVLSVTLQTLNWLVVQQQWSLAEQLIDQAKTIKSKFNQLQQAQFYVYSAQLFIKKDQLNNALKQLNKAVAINPNLGDALLSLANLYHQKKQFTQARLMYVRAQSLPNYKLSAWLGMAQLDIDSQNYKAALVNLRKAFKANPQRNNLITNIRALEKLVRHES